MQPEFTRDEEQPWAGAALAGLRAWLVAHHVGEDEVHLVAEHIPDFYSDAFGVLGFPPAVGITVTAKARRVLEFRLIWPSALTSAERSRCEDELSETFERNVVTPLAASFRCRLTFTDQLPESEEESSYYFGPHTHGYEALAARFLAMKQTLARSPDVAQDLTGIIQSFPQKTKPERRALAQRASALIARLRSA